MHLNCGTGNDSAHMNLKNYSCTSTVQWQHIQHILYTYNALFKSEILRHVHVHNLFFICRRYFELRDNKLLYLKKDSADMVSLTPLVTTPTTAPPTTGLRHRH